jgi:DNA repair protein RecN (Recombination protein N)
MLLKLFIKDFALIDDLDICFENGLNIMTGETGAGKSIIIDAINMVIGERASMDYIRTGKQGFEVEAVFEYSNPDIDNLLNEYGITPEDNIIIINRQIISQGRRSLCRINGKTVTVSFLKKIARLIIDIHGQHHHQSLLDKENHLKLLDLMGPNELYVIKENVEEHYNSYLQLRSLLRKKEKELDDLYKQKERLEYEFDEIEKAQLIDNEDIDLRGQKQILENAEKIFFALEEACNMLYKGEELPSVSDNLSSIISSLEDIKEYFKRVEPIIDTLKNILYEIEDISSTVRNYRESIDFDVRQLDEINSRLDLIERLKFKYDMTIPELIDYKKQASVALDDIYLVQDEIQQTNTQLSGILGQLIENSTKLHNVRKKVAKKLQDDIKEELTDLGMKNIKFHVNIERQKVGVDLDLNGCKTKCTKDGFDDVEFLISTNPGEPLKPLAKIVSGGETSRIMLALKGIMAKVDSISCLIFDEIDAGIGGRAAQIVGEKLSNIARSHQILCVTHSPQIASLGDTHFLIKKEVKGNKTFTRIIRLHGEKRISELARMLGGAEITSKTLAHAKEMLNMSNEIKKNGS